MGLSVSLLPRFTGYRALGELVRPPGSSLFKRLLPGAPLEGLLGGLAPFGAHIGAFGIIF